MPVRIMHVVDTLRKGGLENGLVNLIEHMDPAEFEHVVLTIRGLGPNRDRLPERVRVECLGKKPGSRSQVGVLAQAIRRLKPDIVHSRNWPAIDAVLAGRWARGCFLVHSEHGIETDASVREPRRRTWLRRLAFELADRVVSVSHQLRDFHAMRTGFAASRISVIHNGVNDRRFHPDALQRTAVRKELGVGEDEFCVGCVANLLPVKDHMTLLRALEHADQAFRKWRLLLVGDGAERPRLEEFVRAHPSWDSRVHFLGTSNRVPELLAAMDVYVLPSVNEGINNSLLEAMASERPVIATATGGNPEIVIDGESGLLFPVGDSAGLSEKLLMLEKERELRLKLGQQARSRVCREFSMDSMVHNYQELYSGRKIPARAPQQAGAGA